MNNLTSYETDLREFEIFNESDYEEYNGSDNFIVDGKELSPLIYRGNLVDIIISGDEDNEYSILISIEYDDHYMLSIDNYDSLEKALEVASYATAFVDMESYEEFDEAIKNGEIVGFEEV